MSYSHLVTRSGTAKKSSFHDRLAFMKVRCTGLPYPQNYIPGLVDVISVEKHSSSEKDPYQVSAEPFD